MRALLCLLPCLIACGPDTFVTSSALIDPPQGDAGAPLADSEAMADGSIDPDAPADPPDASSADVAQDSPVADATDASDASDASDSAPPTYIYSQSFTGGVVATSQCSAFDSWRASLPAGPFSRITLSGSNDLTGRTCTGATADTLCQALRSGSNVGPFTCNGHPWQVYNPGRVELSAENLGCSLGYDIRPCTVTPDWGGVNTVTCGGPSQTMTVVCQ
jgi:hypothetical protein